VSAIPKLAAVVPLRTSYARAAPEMGRAAFRTGFADRRPRSRLPHGKFVARLSGRNRVLLFALARATQRGEIVSWWMQAMRSIQRPRRRPAWR